MTEQQLARKLVQSGVVTPQQVQHAAGHRAIGVGIAQALVDTGAAQPIDILMVDAHAFDRVPAPPAAPAAPRTTPAAEPLSPPDNDDDEIGLGQGRDRVLDETGVVFEGEYRTEIGDPAANTVVMYCNHLLLQAVSRGASDLHIEPREEGLLPRYRVDGHLHAGNLQTAEMSMPVISRFKVLASLDITENRMPQDGRFRATVGGHLFDFRVSSLPSIHGEKIVIRLLDRSALVTDLVHLGFSRDSRSQFGQMLKRAFGMILITGPTGSGKTTTLYAALSAAQDDTKNVVTVEDPVEYQLAGVTQTTVNAEIGLSFATQLRAVLRQDPDVILVGEIRDTETAEVSVRAALTGHLVLSTLHTNSAVAAVTRLQDMDIPPFLIASSVSGVVAQRLVRMICRDCREEIPAESAEYQEAAIRLKLPEGTPLFHGRGCANCNNSGTRGRLAIVEVLNIDSDMRRAIMDKIDSDSLRKIAIQSGMKTLWEDALDKLARGLTTADEIARVLLGSDGAED